MQRLWGDEMWKLRSGSPACWDGEGGGQTFFDNVRRDESCSRNWYEGSPGELGRWGPNDDDGDPRFTEAAPALLGFADSIDMYIDNMDGGGDTRAAASVYHNSNMMQLLPLSHHSICVNYQWLVCAARGLLHGQGSTSIRFSYPPGRLAVLGASDGGPSPRDYSGGPLGPDDTGLPELFAPRCVGQPGCLGWEAHQVLGSTDAYSSPECHNTDDCFWSGDVFHLEVCLLNSICDNGAEIFSLAVGELWHCNVSDAGLDQVKRWLLNS